MLPCMPVLGVSTVATIGWGSSRGGWHIVLEWMSQKAGYSPGQHDGDTERELTCRYTHVYLIYTCVSSGCSSTVHCPADNRPASTSLASLHNAKLSVEGARETCRRRASLPGLGTNSPFSGCDAGWTPGPPRALQGVSAASPPPQQ